MAELLTRFQGLPWYGKALAILAIPLIIFLAFFSLHGKILDLIESATRAKVDKQGSQLAQQVTDLNNQAAQVQGSVDELEKQRAQAKQNAEAADAVAFHNSRPNPDKQ